MKVLTLLLLAGNLFGQRVLYNQTLDKQGQDAAAAAQKLASAPVTSKELQNLTTVEKQQIDGDLQAGFLTMRTEVQAFGTWEIVSRSVCKTIRMIYAPDEVQALLISAQVADHAVFDPTCAVAALRKEREAFEARTQAVRASLSDPMAQLQSLSNQVKQKAVQLQAKSAAPVAKGAAATPKVTDKTIESWVKSATDRAADVQQLLQFAQSLDSNIKTDGQVKALQQIGDGLKQLDALIETVSGIWDSYKGVSVDPRSLVPSKEKLGASLLAIDADRLKELTAIRARNALYLDDLRRRLEDCMSLLDSLQLWYRPIEVEDTLNDVSNKPNRINELLALHLATAGAVANQTPLSVQIARESIAERRAAVRRDAVYNGAYEQALQAAGQRLAAYYGAGIKPTQLAALLYYLSGMVSLPKLAF